MLIPERMLSGVRIAAAWGVRVGAMVVAAPGAVLTLCGCLASSPDSAREKAFSFD